MSKKSQDGQRLVGAPLHAFEKYDLSRSGPGAAPWLMPSAQNQAIVAASNGDRDWFAQHPARSHRLRPAVPHEVAAFGADHDVSVVWWIAVRQVQPGVRIRRPFTPPSPPPDDETLGQVLFDLIADYGAAGIGQIPMVKIIEQWSRVTPAGRA